MQLALTTESLCNIWNLCFVLIEFIFPFILTVTWVCDNIVGWSHSHGRLALSHILTLPTRVDGEGVSLPNTLFNRNGFNSSFRTEIVCNLKCKK